jgi:hypothetical protein
MIQGIGLSRNTETFCQDYQAVELNGIEPMTSGLQSPRSPS